MADPDPPPDLPDESQVPAIPRFSQEEEAVRASSPLSLAAHLLTPDPAHLLPLFSLISGSGLRS